MKDVVFERRVGVVVASVVSLTLLWAALVVPGGATWTSVAWTTALVVLLVATSVVLLARERSPLMAEVIRKVEAEPRAAVRPFRLYSLARGPR